MGRIDVTSDQLERRWFAVQNACVTQRHDCDHIRQSLEAAELAWRRAHARLQELESLRDSLGQALAEEDARHELSDVLGVRREVTAA
jgi:ribosomal 50S subunit-associated protein YjgA (DUF615 family)